MLLWLGYCPQSIVYNLVVRQHYKIAQLYLGHAWFRSVNTLIG